MNHVRRRRRMEALLCVAVGVAGFAVTGARGAAHRVVAQGPDVGLDGLIVSQRVSIQSASRAMLQTLPGIGPVLATRIHEARATGACWTHLASLDEISGIGAKTLEGLAPYAYGGCAR